MKRVFIIFIFLVIATSCEDVIEVDLPSSEPRLVIDAYLNIFTQETPARLEGGVRLSLSADYFDDEVPIIENAIVFITDLGTGIEYPLNYTGEDGWYRPENSSDFLDFATDYELTVIHENETYIGTAQIQPVAPINEVRQGTRTLFDGDEIEVIVSFNDDGARDNYYLYEFGFDEFQPIEDQFFQGSEIVFSTFFEPEDVSVGDTITVKGYGITKQYYTYIELILEQTGDGGGPFQSLPATTRGNIINTTDFDNFPLGYFLISEADEEKLTIQEL